MTREEYAERQQRRIERLETRAANACSQSEQLHDDAKRIASAIPFGQPILVGHHSEGRDRRYRARIENKFRKAYEASQKANYWQSRIEAAQSNTSISSDDPDAIPKLEAKIQALEDTLEAYKAINKIARSRKSLDVYSEEDRVRDLMEQFGFSQAHAESLIEDDRLHGRGVPSFSISNMRQNCTRYKQRLAELQRKAQEVAQEKAFETSEGTVIIRYNTEENRVQLFFPGIPGEDTRSMLKHRGFCWSRRFHAWQRQLTNSGKYEAKRIVKMLLVEPDEMKMDTDTL